MTTKALERQVGRVFSPRAHCGLNATRVTSPIRREDRASGADGTIPRAGRTGAPLPVSKTPIDGSLNEIGCEEGKRDCLVDLSDAAGLAACDGFGTGLGIDHEFV